MAGVMLTTHGTCQDISAAPADETEFRSKAVNNRATAATGEWAWQNRQTYKKKSEYSGGEQELESSGVDISQASIN